MPTAIIIGAGPGLGMSIAHRFGRVGHHVAIVSRSNTRHGQYLASLAEAGIDAAAYAADVNNRTQLRSALDAITDRFGDPDVVYYGPAAFGAEGPPRSITKVDAAAAQAAMGSVYAAIDVVNAVLPGMRERGDGGLLFSGGTSSIMPIPQLGAAALSSAALRNYALTLNAALAPHGVYAGTITIGGSIARSDLHRFMTSQPGQFGSEIPTLDPDDIADAAWELYTKRDRAEEVIYGP